MDRTAAVRPSSAKASQLRRLSIGGLVLGAVALALAPVAAHAAKKKQPVIIQGRSGKQTANVVKHRLLVRDDIAAYGREPKNFVRLSFLTVSEVTCKVVGAPPNGKALVVTDLVVNVFENPTPGGTNAVRLAIGKGCGKPAMVLNPLDIGPTVISLGTGWVVPSGESLRVIQTGNVKANISGSGYTIPAAVAPDAAGDAISGDVPD